MKKINLKPYSWVECTPEIKGLLLGLTKLKGFLVNKATLAGDKKPDWLHLCICPNGDVADCHIDFGKLDEATKVSVEDFLKAVYGPPRQQKLVYTISRFTTPGVCSSNLFSIKDIANWIELDRPVLKKYRNKDGLSKYEAVKPLNDEWEIFTGSLGLDEWRAYGSWEAYVGAKSESSWVKIHSDPFGTYEFRYNPVYDTRGAAEYKGLPFTSADMLIYLNKMPVYHVKALLND